MMLEQAVLLASAFIDNAILSSVLACCLAWSVWRIWRFTLVPFWYANDPPEYPYIIPVLGHAFGLFNDSNRLLSDARTYFGYDIPVFGLTAAGQTTYVVTSGPMVSDVYRNTTSLSFNMFVQELMRWAGNSERCIEVMYEPPNDTSNKPGFPNPHGKPLGTLSRDLHMNQLFPGEKLTMLLDRFRDNFEHSLRPESLGRFALDATPKGAPKVPLMAWISRTFSSAGQDAYFGTRLRQICPDLVEHFLEFDELGWQVLYQYPRLLSHKMHAARDKIVDALKTYFTLDPEQRSDAAWFVPAEEKEMRALGIETDDIATMMLVVYWAINTNTPKACFWALYHILRDDDLLRRVKAELRGANKNGRLDVEYVISSCPLLSAIFNETLRKYAFSGSIRFVAQDMNLGNNVLRSGSRLLIAYRQLHFDKDVFGENVADFDEGRFLEDERRTQSSKFRPFGGGSTHCPGRFIARQSALIFIAMVLQQYDAKLAPGQKLASADFKRPVLGMATLEEGTADVVVEMSKRD